MVIVQQSDHPLTVKDTYSIVKKKKKKRCPAESQNEQKLDQRLSCNKEWGEIHCPPNQPQYSPASLQNDH